MMLYMFAVGLLLIIIIGIFLVHLSRKAFKDKWNKVFPDCPFQVRRREGEYSSIEYFNMPSFWLDFEVRKGTRSDGIWGVISVTLTDYATFPDGTDMIALQKDLNTLCSYLSSIGLEIYCEHNLIKEVNAEVAKVSNLKYLARASK